MASPCGDRWKRTSRTNSSLERSSNSGFARRARAACGRCRGHAACAAGDTSHLEAALARRWRACSLCLCNPDPSPRKASCMRHRTPRPPAVAPTARPHSEPVGAVTSLPAAVHAAQNGLPSFGAGCCGIEERTLWPVSCMQLAGMRLLWCEELAQTLLRRLREICWMVGVWVGVCVCHAWCRVRSERVSSPLVCKIHKGH